MNKIIIFGFSHNGTSILKSIIGHIDNVYVIFNETKYITEEHINKAKKNNKDTIIIKVTQHHISENFFDDIEYKDYIKYFIIRNPAYVFSSINRRSNYNVWESHSLEKYTNIAKKFVELQNDYRLNKSIFLIRYEDLFINNYQNLTNIIKNTKFLNFNDKIYNNELYKNYINDDVDIPDTQPIDETDGENHKKFRAFQINQKFENMNNINKIDLTKEQIEFIKNDSYIKILYPDINDLI
jgi:hypothetical protein